MVSFEKVSRLLRHRGDDLTGPFPVCIVAILVLVATVWITCWTQEEQEREAEFGAKKSYVSSTVEGCLSENILALAAN